MTSPRILLTMTLLLTLAGCGGTQVPEVTLEPYVLPEELRVAPGSETPPPEPPGPTRAELVASAEPLDPNPTFSEHVAPILFESCAVCHRPGGSAPFSLTTYDSGRKRSGQIAHVTETGYMPPWQPVPGYNRFRDERLLSPEAIATLARWAKSGAPAGDPALIPDLPDFPEGWQLGEPDLVLEFPETYQLRAEMPDVFRNFVIPDTVEESHYVRAYEFDPGPSPQVVHHVEIRVDETDASLERDLEDPVPGFEGMDVRSAHYPQGFFLNWVPGKTPAFEPEGKSWILGRGTDLVVQLHMLPSGKVETVAPRVALHFADGPPRGVLPSMIGMGTRTLEIPAGESDYVVRDTYPLPVDVEVLGMLPHAHYIGKSFKLWATLPDGSKRWLLRIDDWDFNWQDEYHYVEPIALPRGTVLGAEIVYDNSADNERNPHDPPIHVSWGPRSSDEMGDLWIRVQARSEIERSALQEHVRRHVALQRAEIAERKVRSEPDALTHLEIAGHYESVSMPERAMPHLRAALKLAPDNARVHDALGLALRDAGSLEESGTHLARAVELAPNDVYIRFNHAMHFVAIGDPAGAARELRRAVASDGSFTPARSHLATIAGELGEHGEALAEWQAIIDEDPDNAEALAGAARILALHPQPEQRDPVRARALASEACRNSARRNARALLALAATRAAEGRFGEASELVDEASPLVSSSPRDPLRQLLESDRAAYAQRVLPPLSLP